MQYASTLMLHPEPRYDRHRVHAASHPELGLSCLSVGSDCTGGGYLWTPGSLPALIANRAMEEAARTPAWRCPGLEHSEHAPGRVLERGLGRAHRRLRAMSQQIGNPTREHLTYRAHDTWESCTHYESATGQALGVLIRDGRIWWSVAGHLHLLRRRDGHVEELTCRYIPPGAELIAKKYPNLLFHGLGISAEPLVLSSGHEPIMPGDRYVMATGAALEDLPAPEVEKMFDGSERDALGHALLARVERFSEAAGLILIDM